MQKNDMVAIVGCSNPLPDDSVGMIKQLQEKLMQIRIRSVVNEKIFVSCYADAKERAIYLMDCYENPQIKAIFDVSGGDMANEILPYVDFEVLKRNPKPFYGYSDLTTIINAIYQMTKQTSVLYQVRNILPQGMEQKSIFQADVQEHDLKEWLLSADFGIWKEKSLGKFSYHFVQGEKMSGVVVGGNIRCLLKLAGTPYFPDVTDKILFLEARSGQVPQVTTYFSQLRQMGVFEKANGILLGTYSSLDLVDVQAVERLLCRQVRNSLPVVRTDEIGHGANSKALCIGEYYDFLNE